MIENGAGITGGRVYFLVFRIVQPPALQLDGPLLGRVTLTWNSFSNGIYRVRYKAAVDTSTWTTLGPNITATGNSASVTDTVGSQTQRFYQVTLLP